MTKEFSWWVVVFRLYHDYDLLQLLNNIYGNPILQLL